MTNQAKPKRPSHDRYKAELRDLQIELAKLQSDLTATDARICVLVEGRDMAGKDGIILRMTEHLSPRRARVVALDKPSDRERRSWYFQRYIAHLPAAGELVLFNRSWYNRAVVEPVMGFCTESEHNAFIHAVTNFESMLVEDGMTLIKYWLDIDRAEQARRLAARKTDPLKRWKLSPMDEAAQERWDDYSRYRDRMLVRTDHAAGPWTLVDANEKRTARLNVIRDLLSKVQYKGRNDELAMPDPAVVFPFDASILSSGRLAP